jgi:cytochrome c-type biogenesis protein CcmH/NrfG
MIRPPLEQTHRTANNAMMRNTVHLILTAAFVLIIVAAMWMSLTTRQREVAARHADLPPEPPLPANLEQLSPDLRQRIEAQARAVRESPADGERRGTLGMVYHANGLSDLAVECYTHAIKLAPRQARWFYFRAMLHQQAGRLDDVAADFLRTTQLDPGFSPAFIRLGEVQLALNNLDAAADAMRYADRLAPEDPAMLYVLADLYLRTDQANHIRVMLEERLDERPEDRHARYLLGLALRQLGREDEAAAMFENSSDQRPSWTDELLYQLSHHRAKPSGS